MRRAGSSGYNSQTTENQSLSYDRQLTPRSTTSLRDIPPHFHNILMQTMPEEYRSRHVEYIALIRRGATPRMCETFHLEFDKKQGIYAWADDDIFNTFSGSGMVEGDRWRIRLGCRIQLDPLDPDGSEFMEDLLEEALFYPVHNEGVEWVTIRAPTGEWVTQPVPEKRRDVPLDEYLRECRDEGNGEQVEDADFMKGPVVFEDRYDTSDDVGEAEDEIIQDADTNYYRALTHGPGDYSMDVDEQQGAEGEDEDFMEAGVDDGEGAEDTLDSDEPGSDWDSDEALSGDESLGFIYWRNVFGSGPQTSE